MFRPLLIVFLSFTTFAGFASGIRHVHQFGWHRPDHDAFERHLADICADAALRANTSKTPAPGN